MKSYQHQNALSVSQVKRHRQQTSTKTFFMRNEREDGEDEAVNVCEKKKNVTRMTHNLYFCFQLITCFEKCGRDSSFSRARFSPEPKIPFHTNCDASPSKFLSLHSMRVACTCLSINSTNFPRSLARSFVRALEREFSAARAPVSNSKQFGSINCRAMQLRMMKHEIRE